MSDLLLSVGIDISSLKTARTQIGAELKSWKFPETEKVMPIDTKQLSDSKKFAVELRKEFEKLGTTIGKGDIMQISKAYAPVDLDKQEEQLNLLERQKEQSEKLAKSTSFYKAQTDALGPSIAAVRAELNAYLHAEQSGIALTEQEIARKNELITTYTKLNAQQKTMLHGLNVPRLLLWAGAWTALYSAMRFAMEGMREVFTTIRDLNESINEMRLLSSETAVQFDKDWRDISNAIVDASKNSVVNIKKLQEGMARLYFEGTNIKEVASAAAEGLKILITVTKDEQGVYQALSETMGFAADKLVNVSTESDKLTKIVALLHEMYTRGHVTMSEYNTMMSRVGITARNATPNFETLVAFLQLMDVGFKGNRMGGMLLTEMLIKLTQNTDKLAETFGITFDPEKPIYFTDVLEELRKRIGLTIDKTEEFYLKEIGLSGEALEALRFVLENYELVNKQIERNKNLTIDTAKAHAVAKAELHGLAKIMQNVVAFFAERPDPEAVRLWAEVGYIGGQTWNEFYEAWKRAHKTIEETSKDAAMATKELNKEIGMTVSELEKIPIVIKTYEIPFALKKNVLLLKQELKIRQQELDLRKIETIGASETLLTRARTQIIEEQIYASILKIAYKTDDEVKQQERISSLLKLRGADYKTIYSAMKDLSVDEKDINEYILELLKQRQSLIEEQASIQLKMFEEIKSLADEIESKTVDFVKNLMGGTASVKDFMQSIIDAYKSAFAEQVGGMLADTGLFTGMAEVFLSPIQKAKLSLETGILDGSKAGSKLFYDSIIAASSGAAQPGAAAAPQAAGGISGFMQSISSMFGGGVKKVLTAQTATVTPMAAAGGATQVPVKPAEVSKMAQAGQLAGKALGVAGALYGAYQGIAAQKGVGKGMGALGGALSGAMAGTMLLPGIGTVVGAVVGAIGGFFMGGKKAKAPEPEIRQQTLEIKSALQISNKELQLINRNITGMRRDWEGYIMPRSSFFAEKMGVEERFNLSRSRGIL